jgi:hypothetical protein
MDIEPIKKKKCLICRKDLRKLTKTEEWDSRVYHITCWANMIRDIKHFDKIAYTKYGHKKLIDGKTIEEHKRSNEPIIVSFD